MSAIANFKKRREAEKAKQQKPSNQYAASTPAPENEALWLLGKLFNCSNELAIGAAEAFVGKGLHIVDDEVHMFEPNPHYVDPASGPDKTVITQVTRDDDGKITAITELSDSVNSATDSVNHAADSVTDAAGKVEQSASAIDDSANDLAYSADSIANAASDIKEATAELKKPSAAPKSSRSKKAAAPKKN
ncbi:hypothetical protein [Shewanella ulleungensis]|uniref:hypothetical protein n=1 Tax=Shewanella ulleungensis TaxID=2282699 RepID=UPI003D78EECE